MRFGVLVSGRGSNLESLISAQNANALGPARLAVVISNRPGVRALDIARSASIPAVAIDHTQFENRGAFEQALIAELAKHDVQAIALSGFMRLLSEAFLQHFPSRVLNIHPSLLPAFPGAHAHRDAIAYGVKQSGCTVHLVTPGLDDGPIVLQAAAPVFPNDTEETLSARILPLEHAIFPEACRLLAEGRLRVLGRVVHTDADPKSEA